MLLRRSPLRLLTAEALRRAASAHQQHGAAASFSLSAAAAAAASGLPADALARIKELRERTGAPLADVKASLASCGWDMDAAVEALRARGLKAAAKKSARRAAEGLVAVVVGGGVGDGSESSGGSSPAAAAVVEINSETDFVARNPDFQALALQVARGALEHALRQQQSQQQQQAPSSGSGAAGGKWPSSLYFIELSPSDVAAAPMPASASSSPSPAPATVGDAVAALAAKVRENVVLRRAFLARAPPSASASSPAGRGHLLGAYVHAPAAEGVGRIVSLAVIERGAATGSSSGGGANDGGGDCGGIARQVAMHVAGMSPLYADADSVPPEALAAERARLADEAARDPASAKKPEAVRAKVVEGRLGKWLDGATLSRQPFVLDDSVRVSEAVARAAGKGARVAGFLRVQVGEGAADDDGVGGGFADEVAKLAGG